MGKNKGGNNLLNNEVIWTFSSLQPNTDFYLKTVMVTRIPQKLSLTGGNAPLEGNQISGYLPLNLGGK